MTEARKLNCGQANRLLRERLEGVLAPREEDLLQAHWQRCPGCAERARRLVAAVQALRSAPAPEPRVPLAARIRAAATQALRETPAPAPRLRPAPAWAAAALAAALLIMAFTLHGPALVTRGKVPSGDAGHRPAVAVAPPVTARSLPEKTSTAVVAAAVAVATPAAHVAVLPVSVTPVAHYYRLERVSMSYPARPAARPTPHSAYVHARATMADTAAAEPEDTTGAAGPEADRVARVDSVQAAPVSDNSGDFANEVVGGLVADAVLSTYLEGAPANVKITPAVMTTGNGE